MFISKYAVIELAGKQFIVTEGEKIKVYKSSNLNNFNTLLYRDENSLTIGFPHVAEGGVTLNYIGDKKVKSEVRRFKGKSRYRINKSHSDIYSVYMVSKIDLKSKNSILLNKEEAKKPTKVIPVVPKKVLRKAKKTVTKTTKSLKGGK